MDGAPVVVAPIGQTTKIQVPRGLSVPTDFPSLRREVARSLNELVTAARHGLNDVQLDEPPSAEELAERAIPRNWVATATEGSVCAHPDAHGAAGFIAAAASRLLPRFITERYSIVVRLRPIEEWLAAESPALELSLRREHPGDASRHHPDDRFAEFPIELVADGLRLWVQLALLEACEQAARAGSVLTDLAVRWWDVAESVGMAYQTSDEAGGDERDAEASARAATFRAVVEELRSLAPGTKPWVGGLLAHRLEQPDSEDWTRRDGRHRRFFLVDEPERHLHPNLQREAALWLRDLIRSRDTPCLVATHRTPFLALPTDSRLPLYVYVTREERGILCEPFDADELRPLDRIATALGFDRGELLTTVSLFLLVEGSHDVVVLERMFEELRAARIAVVSMEGLSNYKVVLDSDVLWRYTTAEIALTTDKFDTGVLAQIVGDPRATAGRLGGRVNLYSALNRDAARAARRKDYATAELLAKAAARLDASPEAKRIAAALSTIAGAGGISSAAELARLLAAPQLAAEVTGLQRKLARARRGLDAETAPAQFSGRIVALNDVAAMLELQGLPAPVSVPAVTVRVLGVGAVGSPVVACWEILAGGRTMLSVEPAIEMPDVNEFGEPLVDMYGTLWGKVLSGIDPEALTVSGTPTVRIPAGIPDVE